MCRIADGGTGGDGGVGGDGEGGLGGDGGGDGGGCGGDGGGDGGVGVGAGHPATLCGPEPMQPDVTWLFGAVVHTWSYLRVWCVRVVCACGVCV